MQLLLSRKWVLLLGLFAISSCMVLKAEEDKAKKKVEISLSEAELIHGKLISVGVAKSFDVKYLGPLGRSSIQKGLYDEQSIVWRLSRDATSLLLVLVDKSRVKKYRNIVKYEIGDKEFYFYFRNSDILKECSNKDIKDVLSCDSSKLEELLLKTESIWR